jgi:pyruvate dehydrogenase E2 component (dihydrolipoamide acetyltransferase)
VKASPLAKRIADERGVDLRAVRGSGPGGRIVKRDVEAAQVTPSSTPEAAPSAPARPAATAAAPKPAAAPAAAETIQMSRMRQAIARRMSQSKREAPHYYLLVDIDMTDAMTLRKQINASLSEEERVSVNDLIVRACALALDRHPAFNVTGDGEQFTRQPLENVCIAIALDDGLIAPAIMDVANKRLPQIARETKDLVARAKGGSLSVDEVTQGTFSITNLGAYGIETLVGIIQPPQTAILGVGTVMEQPAVRDGAIVVRQMMKVALSADHRVTDGAQGAQFLGEIKGLLEAPMGLVL